MNSRIRNWASSLAIALIALQITALPSSADNQTPTQIADSIPGAGGSEPLRGAVLNGKYYFTAYDPVNGFELRVYDGTNPPSLVQDIATGTTWGSYSVPIVFNDKLYFNATDGTNGNELWVYDDGTGLATMVQDIRVGIGGSQPQYLTVFDNKLYFSAYVVATGRELWSYDGTSSATNAKDIKLGSSSSTPQYLTVFNNKLYFAADDGGGQGYELWSYDSTGSVNLVQDINPGSNPSYPSYLGVFEDNLYFAAYDGTNGTELWVYGGTSATVIDINPTGSGIDDMEGPGLQLATTSMGLFFTGSDGTTGFELWSIAPAPAPAATPAPYTGPLLQEFSSRTLDVCTPKSITITGVRLSGVTASVQGKSVTVLENTATKLVLAFPAGLTPAQDVDLVINSSSGTLTHQDAFDIPADTCTAVLSKGRWTQLQSDGKTVKMYAKDPIGDGKIQFFVDGEEIAWVNAVDESDPKLSFASSYPYLVRSVELKPGKNRFEIKLDGVRVWRATYVPKV